jgi:hypothetical protein
MPTVFEVLGGDHLEVKRMLAELESGPTALTGASDSQLGLRKKMVEELIIEESKHEALEEMYFWPAVRDLLPDGGQLADTAIHQEQEGKEVLDLLDKLKADQPEFEGLISKFIPAGREHISYEETRVWPLLRRALTEEESISIGTKIHLGWKTAPIRPHPHTPASPGVLKWAEPAVATADRLRAICPASSTGLPVLLSKVS